MKKNTVIDHKPYMENDSKVYVDVNEDRLKDGSLIPLSIIWEDGRRFEIDKILDIRHAASLKAGGAGIRYTVCVRDRETYLYLEKDKDLLKWFMERK